MKLYGIKDKVMKKFTTLVIANTDEEAIRKATMATVGVKPLRDCEVYEVGACDEEDGTIKGLDKKDFKLISWDKYTLPQTKAEDLSVLNNNMENLQ